MSLARFAVRKQGPRIPLAPAPGWSPCWPEIRARRKARARAARLADDARQCIDNLNRNRKG